MEGSSPRKAHDGAGLLERLLGHTSPEPNTGCMLWLGPVQGDGYPQVYVPGTGYVRTHRLVLELATGAVGAVGEHLCNQPLCLNPSHLRWGTHQTNIAQRHSQGRDAVGERNGRAKLTAEAVEGIRTSGRPVRLEARLHGVSPKLIRRIRKGEIWKGAGSGALEAQLYRAPRVRTRTFPGLSVVDEAPTGADESPRCSNVATAEPEAEGSK